MGRACHRPRIRNPDSSHVLESTVLLGHIVRCTTDRADMASAIDDNAEDQNGR